MKDGRLDPIEKKILKFIKKAIKDNTINKEKFKVWWRDSYRGEINFVDFCTVVLRTLVLNKLYYFCLWIGIPVDRNPHYKTIFDLWQENEEKIEKGDRTAKSIMVTMLPRGALKSTIQIAKGNWFYLRRAVIMKQAPIVLVAHGNIDKAQENLTLLRENFEKEELKILFPDVLEYVTKSKTALRFKDNSPIVRRESHFILGSPRSDFTGKHITRGLIDDWVTDENTSSIALNEENKKAFYRLFSLDDHSGGDKISLIIDIVCTEYRDDSLYRDLELNDQVLFIKIPVCTRQYQIGQMKPHEFNFSEILDEKKLSLYKKTLPHNQFISQYDLIPYSREGGLDFDIDLPAYPDTLPSTDERAFVAITADPSISKKNKKSQAVVLVTIIDKSGNLYVVDGIANYGMKPSEHTHNIFILADKWKADTVIIEAIHYQEALAQEVERKMRERPFNAHKFSIKRHKHFINKKEHYKMFLEPLLAQGRIFVNPKLRELIDQIEGRSHLDDQIDCLSFLKELKIDHIAIHSNNKKVDKVVNMSQYKYNNNNNMKESFGYFGWGD